MIDWDGYTIGYYGRPFEARQDNEKSMSETYLWSDCLNNLNAMYGSIFMDIIAVQSTA